MAVIGRLRLKRNKHVNNSNQGIPTPKNQISLMNRKNMNSSYNKMQKVSIRFFNDREVRAVWDEMLSKWG